MTEFNGRTTIPDHLWSEPDQLMQTDASLLGLGGVFHDSGCTKIFTVRFQHFGLVTTFVYMNFWLYSLGWEYGDLYYKIKDFYCNVTIPRLLFW